MKMSPKLLYLTAGLLFFAAIATGWLGINATAPIPDTVKANPPEPEHIVWRFINDVPEGALLHRDHVELVRVTSKQPDRIDDLASVIGQRLSQPAYKGVDLTKNMLTSARAIVDELKPNHRAIAIKATETLSVGGHIKAGDTVDIIHLIKPNQATGSIPIARQLASDIKVLAIGEQLSTSEETDRQENARTVVLELHQSITPLVFLAESAGELRLSMVGHSDLELSPQPQENARVSTASTTSINGAQFVSTLKKADSSSVAFSPKDYRVDLKKLVPNATPVSSTPRNESSANKPHTRQRISQTTYIEVFQGNERTWVKAKH